MVSEHGNENCIELFNETTRVVLEPNLGGREAVLISPRDPFTWITLDNQLFIKKFKVFPDRLYGDMAASTVSIWYNLDMMCEIEPLGPIEILEPGEAASFTKHWYLYYYTYPADRKADLNEVKSIINRSW